MALGTCSEPESIKSVYHYYYYYHYYYLASKFIPKIWWIVYRCSRRGLDYAPINVMPYFPPYWAVDEDYMGV